MAYCTWDVLPERDIHLSVHGGRTSCINRQETSEAFMDDGTRLTARSALKVKFISDLKRRVPCVFTVCMGRADVPLIKLWLLQIPQKVLCRLCVEFIHFSL